jgi:hypothetical protein
MRILYKARMPARAAYRESRRPFDSLGFLERLKKCLHVWPLYVE